MPELAGLVPSHYEVPWRRALGVPYKDGVVSYIGAHCQSTPLHYDDLENLVPPRPPFFSDTSYIASSTS